MVNRIPYHLAHAQFITKKKVISSQKRVPSLPISLLGFTCQKLTETVNSDLMESQENRDQASPLAPCWGPLSVEEHKDRGSGCCCFPDCSLAQGSPSLRRFSSSPWVASSCMNLSRRFLKPAQILAFTASSWMQLTSRHALRSQAGRVSAGHPHGGHTRGTWSCCFLSLSLRESPSVCPCNCYSQSSRKAPGQ